MRVRFAPSPTGALHIGGARTALYNWLAARHHGGTFVLRIEDTDRERSTPENVEQILEALAWLELDFDEGPIFQSQRADRHREVIEQLLAGGHAYRSTATGDDVKAYKERHGADRGFRGEPEDEGAVRLRVPAEGATTVRDLIRGETAFQHVHLDDPVIARADGTPLYNLAVAVDDMDAEITHVIRGDDHYSNTPKQLLVLEALGAQQPTYARSEEHTSELQSRQYLVCRLLLEKKKQQENEHHRVNELDKNQIRILTDQSNTRHTDHTTVNPNDRYLNY